MTTQNEDQYKFPEEADSVTVSLDGEDELEIEIQDDTPEPDRHRDPMPESILEELEKDELTDYDDKVKEKFKQLRKVYHDQRRVAEKAQREQEEAVKFTKQIYDENSRLKGMLSSGEKEYVSAITNSANIELELAKKALKEATDAGDTDKMVEATSALQNANLKLVQAKSFKIPPLQNQQNNAQYQPQQSAPEPDQKAVSWQKHNNWFGNNRVMTAAALGIHEELKDEGFPVGSEEYYKAIDKRIRKIFPDEFGEVKINKPKAKSSSVVASATRSTSPNKVTLTQSQVQLAKRLGITPEQYAKELVKLEKSNG